VADGWCWFVVREKYCRLVAGGWFVLREKYWWLISRTNRLNLQQLLHMLLDLQNEEQTSTVAPSSNPPKRIFIMSGVASGSSFSGNLSLIYIPTTVLPLLPPAPRTDLGPLRPRASSSSPMAAGMTFLLPACAQPFFLPSPSI
jgi:hypothetical protein